MHSHWRKISIGAVIAVVAIIGAALAMKWLGLGDRRPALATVPPLAPVTRSSTIVTPVAIALTAIRDALEREAPPDLSGKPDIPSLPFLGNVDIGWSVSRGPFMVTPRREGLAISTALTGSLRAGGQLGNGGGLLGSSGGLQDLLGSLLRGNPLPPGGQDQSERKPEQRPASAAPPRS
jgi:hypothetical protein